MHFYDRLDLIKAQVSTVAIAFLTVDLLAHFITQSFTKILYYCALSNYI
jgi:hypothetical protein